MTKVVHKFGGSSLSSAARYQAVANIILGQCQAGDCVVVSAAGKTTNTLVKLWQSYVQKDDNGFNDILLQVENHQNQLLSELFDSQQVSALSSQLKDELQSIAKAAKDDVLHEATLLAHGEIWSARLLARLLCTLNVDSQDVDARSLFTQHQGQLLHAQNKQACLAQIKADKIYVVTGFIASDCDAKTITLGRNGSDYSATLLANYIDAKAVSIWTDTQGVFSTDPRKVSSALKYPKVCRVQANLLARLGNPVLHAKTLSPLKDTNIKLQVRSSYDPEVVGTEIVKQGYSKDKRFITTFDELDLIRVEGLAVGEVRTLSQLIQHSIHHFNKGGDDYLLVPSKDTHAVASHLAGRGNIVESHLRGLAIVAPSHETAHLTQQAATVLEQQDVVVRFTHSDGSYALFLTDQSIDSDVLAILHDKLVNKGRELAVIIAGLGNVGEVFVEQCQKQVEKLQATFDLKVVALVRSKGMLFCPSGINIKNWQQQWRSEAQDYQPADLLERIGELDYENKVVIDITASDAFSNMYPSFVAHDCHLISANKYAGTAEQTWYGKLLEQLQERNLHWRYNTSVGAGLPINFALADLQNSGDTVMRIEGVFSGTLSWLCSSFDGSKAFSELVLEAQSMGYTEPDPREDLSGRDMQRKLLILARDLGLQLDVDDIVLEPLMPAHLADGDWDSFLAKREALDEFYQSRYEQAQSEGKALRYTGALEVDPQGKVSAKVGIAYAEAGSAIANLTPGDNIFVITSQWYESNPLVIQGPGAGKEVTAAGIHSDLYWLTQKLK
ncbi:bifunctional aspartate kinase/homoserine dehydrogenase II [Pseudoalteromonas luteoviolacea]|uniref:Bifunctional aspartokinase/homoserine dehydrogenase n=1 Tax=Pseudoalteromonas luteoviolacea H33 TaxID=1365251 RepID=A0A161XZW6_9GAMM|nr:bifunctional aspartate kinase/homoserine dehydrogenase II [Pseudoalteromonas luteoviolacea]KZN48984.1 aspartate kinase [Pseudoalteromonas luteoviolacea H33]KZN74342.1 aspartate kinase [Pseudoalteromonas luteoviolacea H33-S]MBQ4878553.1 bifunctional aspartate kinase/homoserine dehydrogenase II [Pseudoalteromonas luteoviolacea]MBQ4907708.1 bifunctional aspartate kinase/homoserine dehydrogenase II [Pseudoalteromonas luteoviolacea]